MSEKKSASKSLGNSTVKMVSTTKRHSKSSIGIKGTKDNVQKKFRENLEQVTVIDLPSPSLFKKDLVSLPNSSVSFFYSGCRFIFRLLSVYTAGCIIITLLAETDFLSRPPGSIVGSTGSSAALFVIQWLGVSALFLPISVWQATYRPRLARLERLVRLARGLFSAVSLALIASALGGQWWGGNLSYQTLRFLTPHIGVWGLVVVASAALFALHPNLKKLALVTFISSARQIIIWSRNVMVYTIKTCRLSGIKFYKKVWPLCKDTTSALCGFIRLASRKLSCFFVVVAKKVGQVTFISRRPAKLDNYESINSAGLKQNTVSQINDKLGGIISASSSQPLISRTGAFLQATSSSVPKSSDDNTVRAPSVLQIRQFLKQRKVSRNLVSDLSNDNNKYLPPSISLLSTGEVSNIRLGEGDFRKVELAISEQLASFNIQGQVTERHTGPLVTLYEFQPARGVKVGRITSLQDEIAMGLKASAIRVIAPIPGKDTVGIEVPNPEREVVSLRDVIESSQFTSSASSLTIAVGKDACGIPVVLDIAKMPHLLIAGATGTGKSVCINSILLSLLYRASPDELGLILIDPKILELSVYEDIPHLRVPVVTDCRRARVVLDWAVKEMDRRYRLMQQFGVRSIDSYNAFVKGEGEGAGAGAGGQGVDAVLFSEVPATEVSEDLEASQVVERLQPLPKIVIVIDELADLMFQVGREVEELITRLAQKARAAGIHLVVATQRPSVDVVTGLIKANFPARMSFRVASRIDSRTILDSMGAERLLGRGDMLLMLPGAGPLRRVHGAFVADEEVVSWVTQLKMTSSPRYDKRILALYEREEAKEQGQGGDDEVTGVDYDPQYDQAVALVVAKGQASTSMVQRALRIGYNRAARLIEQMEREGIVGPMDGVKPREVLIEKIPQESEPKTVKL